MNSPGREAGPVTNASLLGARSAKAGLHDILKTASLPTYSIKSFLLLAFTREGETYYRTIETLDGWNPRNRIGKHTRRRVWQDVPRVQCLGVAIRYDGPR